MPYVAPGKRLVLAHTCGHLRDGEDATKPIEIPPGDERRYVIQRQPWPCRDCAPDQPPRRIPARPYDELP